MHAGKKGRKKISLLILERNAVLPIAGKCVSTDAYQPMRCLVQWINYLKLARSVAEKNWDEKNRGGWLVLALVHGGVEKQSYAEERHSWAKWFRPEIRFDPKRYFFCLLSRMPTVYLTLAEKCAHCASNFPICAREPVALPFNSSHRATRHFFFPSPLLYIARNYGDRDIYKKHLRLRKQGKCYYFFNTNFVSFSNYRRKINFLQFQRRISREFIV